jgi:hypothetical protein
MKYDIDFLLKYCKENNIILQDNYENINRDTKITAKCLTKNCNEIVNKIFRNIVTINGCYCCLCSKKIKYNAFIEKRNNMEIENQKSYTQINYEHMNTKNYDFIKKVLEVHKHKYTYLNVNYVNNSKNVTITCRIHGDFNQNAYNHIRGQGCPTCVGKNITTERYVKKAKDIHGDKYDYSKVEYKSAQENVIIICKIHGDFSQRPDHHLNGSCCSKCVNKESRLTNEEFIQKAQKIHGDTYNYSKVEYKSSQEHVIIICKIHGMFSQLPTNHLSGNGCSKCFADNNRFTKEDFINNACEIHGDKYDYSKVEYKSSQENIIIICKIHGEFSQISNSHIMGKGCSKCAGNRKSTTEEFIQKAQELHGDKYDYSSVEYKTAIINVSIICKEHGIFNQTPNNHLKGQECYKCNESNFSKEQIKWLTFIEKKENIKIQHAKNDGEYKIPKTKYKADGYCKETNTIYEYHGDYWHGNPTIFNPNDINKKVNKRFGELYENTLKKN